ncbi:hypothetical protein CMI45_01110 [Candidatus Pacearchaeota archaeon]|nr:hypothetical protein [Candidatus Pacearchaeota archaeon]|tara:strand:+ start:1682 stop:3085 length:1404 start_codon:yes stop_codon:yes gene_type:complete
MFPQLFQKSSDLSYVEKDVEASSLRKVHEKQKALGISIKEGAFSNISLNLGGSYITPFALALNSTPFQIGLLSSLASLVGPFSQLYGSKLLEQKSRKKLVINFVLIQALMWIPIISLSFLFINGFFASYLPYALIVLYAILVAFGGMAYPAWFSWMGDIVPGKDRGRYFGMRTKIAGFVGLTATVISAFFLDIFKTKGLALIGFAILFALAATFRIVSVMLFKKQYSPKFKQKRDPELSFFSFIFKNGNYSKFTIYQFLFHFALMIASPFFAVYMLESLNYSYTTFIVVAMSASVFYLALSPLAGKFADRFGNIRLFYLSTILFASYPLFWIFLKSPILLIIFPQLISGIANAAFLMAFTKFTYDSLSEQHRAVGISYTHVMIGVGMFLGALIGAFLVKYSPSFIPINAFFFVFAASAVLRLILPLSILSRIKEINKMEKLPHMHVEIAHPIRSFQSEISWFRRVTK